MKGMLKNTERFIQTADHHKLFCESFLHQDAKASLLILHGQGEHSGSYDRLIRFLSRQDSPFKLNIFTFDFRGHGRSDGRRGYASHPIQYVEDLEAVLTDIEHSNMKTPLFALAHSMGGLILTEAQCQHSFQKRFQNIFKGQILSAPLFQVALKVPAWKMKSAKWMNQVFPRLTLWNEITDEMLTDDLDVRKEFSRDPLRHQKISPGVFLGFFDFFDDIREHAIKIKTPTHLFISEVDPVVSFPAAKEIFDLFGSQDKKLTSFSVGRHELLNEIARDKIYTLIQNQLMTWSAQNVSI